ncbi:PAS domain-containing sensor histidine kinase [Aerophototrophica crusticola]|uniref:Nitrogen regulation protein n=1 Tax=Aerophototrophica crusticola TaxID=1709002 RepID=A0A858R698_9PROT|nr:PAS domain-containing sensor histidine kinase [Rhodospirillaceae bacterium B3]
MSVATDKVPGATLWRRLAAWSSRRHLGGVLAVLLTLAALISGAATYGALTETPPFGNDPNTVTLLLTADAVLLLLLVVVVARRIVGLWVERRRGLAGSRLHMRLVAVFSLLAVLPAITMAIFSALFFYVGVQSWFSERVRTAVNESLAVAEAYLQEHQLAITRDAELMRNDLIRLPLDVVYNPLRFQQVFNEQSFQRSLTESVIFDGTGRIYSVYGLGFAFDFKNSVRAEELERARRGEVVLLVSEAGNRVSALLQADPRFDTFLFVGRPVESRVLEHMDATQSAVREYRQLEGQRFDLQTRFSLIFLGIAVLLLLAAIWMGLLFATYLVQPIGALIAAAERVRSGDLTARVPDTDGPEDELSSLSRAFNRMTSQLESQRHELVEANKLLDLRRRFTEAVLSGVSAGVLGLDQEGVVNLPNLSAAELLGVGDPQSLVGRNLLEVAPEMADLMGTIRRRPGRLVEGQVQLRRGGQLRTLLVRLAAEVVGGEVKGFVVTFDDVSELLSAQRKAAWADVARRIAHEIKNPLTPIQLSAERLRRKYLKEISSDPDTFRAMTDTIVRHVDDIGKMVDEFSAFARMPSPVMKPVSIQELCRQAVFLQATAQTGIKFETILPEEPLQIVCDSRQIGQALTNLLKNAVEAIEGKAEEVGDDATLPPGQVTLRVAQEDDRVILAVEDNGKGLPTEERDRLTEPYVTTRAKGTGLGLAIVKKIMEDHGGALLLEDRPGGGARVSLVLPRTLAPASPEAAPATLEPAVAVAGRKG